MRKYHSIIWVPLSNPPGATIPLIALDSGEILFEAYYFFTTTNALGHSTAWYEKAAAYLGKFYDYYRATSGNVPLTADLGERLLTNFVKAIQHGTIGLDGRDPTGLFWRPLSPSRFSHAKSILREFCEVIADLWGEDNPLSASNFAHQTNSALAREQKMYHSKFLHLASRGKSFRAIKSDKGARGHVSKRGSAKVFPKNMVTTLLFEGCRRARATTEFSHPMANQFNIPLMMTFTLLFGGGLRKSEIFHMFADDVRADEIRLYDPELGRMLWRDDATNKIIVGQRREYLSHQFGRVPRNRLPHGRSEHAGWKSMLMDYGEPDFYSRVQWISAKQRALFYYLFSIYRDYMRPRGLGHPYLFVSFSHGEFGGPWTIGAFNDAFSEALRRLGEVPDADRGLNPHGMRHLYGQTLVDMKMHPLIIQGAMHHKSIESQLVYTKPSAERISETLQAASEFNSDEQYVIPEGNGLLDYSWKSDPLKLFSVWNLGARA